MTENDINIYNNGKIYTIRCRTDNNLIYVGSTVQPLHKRWHGHKTTLLNGKYNHRLLYNKMNELGIDDFYIELYEHYNCNSKEELNRREGELIREIGNLNHAIAGRTKNEYVKEEKEKIKEHDKQYYDANKELILEKKKYYRENNKDSIKEKKTKPFNCECGCIVQWDLKARHKKSQKHINLMKQKEEEIKL